MNTFRRNPIRSLPARWRLFLAGALVNLLYLAVLFLNPQSRANLYPSDGERITVWQHSDVGTYVRSAQAFCATGVFAGSDGRPDNHRTVGYPLFLSFAMKIGGSKWVEWVLVLQSILFAFIYPALAFVTREWFGATPRQTGMLLLAYALLGAGWAYTPILLTDQAFAVFLWGALALGTQAVLRGGKGVWIGHGVLLLAAASIRPTLAFFPFAFAALAVALGKGKPVAWGRLTAVFAIQMVLCQSPAARNYIHHGVLIPSDVMVDNLSDYLAKDVLAFAGQLEVYGQAEAKWKDRPLAERVSAQTTFARGVFTEHPFVTIGIATVNLGFNTMETHWIQAMHFFRSSLHCDLKRWTRLTPALKVFHSVWALIHAGIALAACCGLWQLARQQRWAFLLFILFFVLPFLYGATDAQGARFRLYIEGLILMLALLAFPERAEEQA